MVSLPSLAESHFKMSINSNSIISQILQKVLLHAFHGNEGFLSLELDRTSLNQGEIAHLLLTPVKGIDLKDIVVHAINYGRIITFSTCCYAYPTVNSRGHSHTIIIIGMFSNNIDSSRSKYYIVRFIAILEYKFFPYLFY